MGFRRRALEGLEMNPAFWKTKRVLLTGHTGFKGAWLTLALKRFGAEVTGYALAPPTEPNLFDSLGLTAEIDSVRADVRDLPRLLETFHSSQPQIAVHLAAQSLVGVSYAKPVDTYAVNVMGTVHFLEAVRSTPSVKVAVIVTSDKCYQNHGTQAAYREDDRLGGHDPYSNSKGAAELSVAAYRDSFFLGKTASGPSCAVASVRAGNVIGGGDWAQDRLIPDMVRAFLRKESARLRGPRAVRPWQHVLEPLSGYLLVAERMWESGPEFAEAWNFGPQAEDAVPVSDLADRFVHYWGEGVTWTPAGGGAYHEADVLRLDSTKAQTRLGWRPRLALDRAIEWTAAWYKSYSRNQPTRALCEGQLQAYLGSLGR